MNYGDLKGHRFAEFYRNQYGQIMNVIHTKHIQT